MPDSIFIDVHDNIYVGEAWGCRVRRIDAQTGIVTTVVGSGIPGNSPDGLPGPETKTNPVESGIWVDPDGTVIYSDSAGLLRQVNAETGLVTTIFGGTSIGDGGPCDAAYLAGPRGLDVGPNGHIYFTEAQSDRVRAIDPATGSIRTVAGNGARAYGGDTGPATEAYLFSPADIAVDARGQLFIVDTHNARLRRVDEAGVITTIAGTGDSADRGDGGPALGVVLNGIRSVALGPDGAVYVSDTGRIRRIDPTTGLIKTVVGTGMAGYTGDGGPASQARIGGAAAMAFDATGNLFFADSGFHVVRKVDADGIITTVVGCGEAGFSPDGTPAREARLHKPLGLAVTSDGTVYVSDSRNNRVRRVADDGTLETVAGSAGGDTAGGLAREARLNEPHGLCFYGPDILLISDHLNNRIKAVRLAPT
jgi:sugar lactone lactonase YvrE